MGSDSGEVRSWTSAAWVVLLVVLAAIVALAVRLLVASGALGSGPLGDAKSAWGFLGAMLAAAVTVLGALLTEQSERRNAIAAREAQASAERAEKERLRLSDVAEKRQQIEATGLLLEQMKGDDGGYAPPAVLIGAVTGLMELGGGTAGLRALGLLWKEATPGDGFDVPTAVRIVEQVLVVGERPAAAADPAALASRERELYVAAELLALHAGDTLPAADAPATGGWVNWPSILDSAPHRIHTPAAGWPVALPEMAQWALVVFVVRALGSRPTAWWKKMEASSPVDTLLCAKDDGDHPVVARLAAAVLRRLCGCGFVGDVFGEEYDASVRGVTAALLGEPTEADEFAPWVVRQLDLMVAGLTGDEVSQTSTRARTTTVQPPAGISPP